MTDFRALCTAALPEAVALLKQLCALESPSGDKAAVDACMAFVADQLRNLGAEEIQSVPQTAAGNHLTALWRGGSSNPGQFLTVCHLDTVWPLGTLKSMPLREADGKLFGPGTYDMKAGTVIVLMALHALKEANRVPKHPVRLIFTSDEEVGSLTSRELIEAEARRSQLALVMEPAMAGGQLKTFRKGVGEFKIVAHGRSAHAGVDHAKGLNAIEELAHQVLNLQKMTDYEQGTTLNVGVIKGGTASNVVPAHAEMDVDFRVSKMSEAKRLTPLILNLRPIIPGVNLSVSGGLNRPPMERTATMIATFEQVRRLGETLGLNLEEGATGGGSDGNFTAALGTPTLDGLGARGDGAHASHEHIIIESLVERAALLATIFTQWS
jgi:glutamate carboxypeptidase